MKNQNTAVVAWTNIEQTTGVAKPYGSNEERARINLDSPLNLEQYWLAYAKLETSLESSVLSPRLFKRYSLILALMHRLELGIAGVLALRGQDLKKHSSKLKGLTLPENVGNFDFVFQTPNKAHVPLSRTKVVVELGELVDEELAAWKDAA